MGKQGIRLLQKPIICSKIADIPLQKLFFILHGKHQKVFGKKMQHILFETTIAGYFGFFFFLPLSFVRSIFK